MSNVIKSPSVQIKSPMVVGLTSGGQAVKDPESRAEHEALGDAAPSGDELAAVKEQAEQILSETESMVRELLGTARNEADKIVKSAQEESRRIVSESRAEAKKIEEEAYKKGLQTGTEQGRAKAEKEYRSKVEEGARLLEEALEERQRLLAGAEGEIIALVLAVARKVIELEVKTNPEVIEDMVRRAIQRATDREELVVRVHPDDLESTIGVQDKFTASVKGIKKLKIIGDTTVSAGGCVVESPNGTVDARIERQIGELEQALTEVRAQSGV